MSLIEIFGFVTGVINVWLLARQNIWNWPVGLLNNALYMAVFVRSGLYGDAGLQGFFIALGLYGWWTWSAAAAQINEPLRIKRTSRNTWTFLSVATIIAALGLAALLKRFTDSTVPGWGGCTTALSLAATYGQCKKLLECWWLWIVVDVIYVPLYIYKGLRPTALLYVSFLILCVIALRAWSKAITLKTQQVSAAG